MRAENMTRTWGERQDDMQNTTKNDANRTLKQKPNLKR